LIVLVIGIESKSLSIIFNDRFDESELIVDGELVVNFRIIITSLTGFCD
jgi:hypothetical protein